jgi:DNA-binding MarR family transcriptional regulator
MFDPLLHQPIRTSIVSAIAANEDGISFKELQNVCNATQGNLASHLKTLEDAEYIEYEKFFESRRPKTVYRLTTKGNAAFGAYIEELSTFISTKRES